MHIVTKILVVFCAVLSLLLAALTMAFASNAQALRDNYKNAENEKIAAILTGARPPAPPRRDPRARSRPI